MDFSLLNYSKDVLFFSLLKKENKIQLSEIEELIGFIK